MLLLLLLGQPAVAAPSKCAWKSEPHAATYDLSHLAKVQDLKFGSPMSSMLAPFAGMMQDVSQQTVSISICGEPTVGASCKGERAPGILVEQDTPADDHLSDPFFSSFFGAAVRPQQQTRRPPRCAVLGRRPASGPRFSLLDPLACLCEAVAVTAR